ncbi:MAG: TatD family hydrolase [Muribaculaceae bacterium]|nr:TatD family hydrolase [Muribaculaceae bacterium]
MIDTHTHLYMPDYDADGGGEAAVRRALAAGVGHMIFPNVDLESVSPMQDLAKKFPDAVSCAMGLHPTELGDDWQANLATVMDLLGDGTGYVAVGEVGIDLYWDNSGRDRQMQAFDIQAGRAGELGLPLIIHCREGLDETLEVLGGHRQVPAVFHSFGGTHADVERIRKVGDYYFGINGIVTFKNSSLREVLPAIGIERLLIETDSPYLAPVPKRGRRNESSFLPYIAAHVADILAGESLESVSLATDANARRLFAKL